ncbi:MAG: hypothetical protein AB1546_13420 [bacterium]
MIKLLNLHESASKLLLLSFFILCSAVISAQELPDTIFNKDAPAFSNIIQDVPPDILSVVIAPESPRADQETYIKADVRVDPVQSIFKVQEVILHYSADNENFVSIPMEYVKDEDIWQGRIPPQPAGAEVTFYLTARDEIGNAVSELPMLSKLSAENLTKVVTDDNDEGIPSSLDFLGINFGTDGTNLLVCMVLEKPFEAMINSSASIFGLGFVEDDLRLHQTRSQTDITGLFIAFAPLLNKIGIFSIEDVVSNRPPRKAGAEVVSKNKSVCARAPISALTSTPERGLKFFAANITLNANSGEVLPGDATPYAIVYFRPHIYKVLP